MIRKIILVFVLLALLSAGSLASETMYQKHNISFQVPTNWSVVKDVQKGNDTQIVLSDNTSAIRIDLIKITDKELNGLANEAIRTAPAAGPGSKPEEISSWKDLYPHYIWFVASGLLEHYTKYMIAVVTDFETSGSGISVKPDGAQAGIATNCGIDVDPIEWIIAWTKPKYQNEYFGIHGLFARDGYARKTILWPGAPREYSMPEPLWTVLTTITKGEKPKTTSLVELV